MNWGGISVDPTTGVVVVNSNRFASYVQLLTREQADAKGSKPQGEWSDRCEVAGLVAQANVPYAADPYFWLAALNIPCIDPPYGYLSAVDLNTGKLLWTQPFGSSRGSGALGITVPFELPMGTPTHGGSMITAGGLLFIAASKDNMFRAYNLATGDVVWQVELPATGGADQLHPRWRAVHCRRGRWSGRDPVALLHQDGCVQAAKVSTQRARFSMEERARLRPKWGLDSPNFVRYIYQHDQRRHLFVLVF